MENIITDASVHTRTPPKECPVCGCKIKTFETGRVLCTSSCDFEWFYNPPKILPERIPEVNVKRLQTPNLTNLEVACYVLGWQGGTVHQVAHTLGVSVDMILNAKSILGLIFAVAK